LPEHKIGVCICLRVSRPGTEPLIGFFFGKKLGVGLKINAFAIKIIELQFMELF
tara:strand:- start:470 stop:631 length:162 start_codon:yes stop_codon:yes gene_type:complete